MQINPANIEINIHLLRVKPQNITPNQFHARSSIRPTTAVPKFPQFTSSTTSLTSDGGRLSKLTLLFLYTSYYRNRHNTPNQTYQKPLVLFLPHGGGPHFNYWPALHAAPYNVTSSIQLVPTHTKGN